MDEPIDVLCDAPEVLAWEKAASTWWNAAVPAVLLGGPPAADPSGDVFIWTAPPASADFPEPEFPQALLSACMDVRRAALPLADLASGLGVDGTILRRLWAELSFRHAPSLQTPRMMRAAGFLVEEVKARLRAKQNRKIADEEREREVAASSGSAAMRAMQDAWCRSGFGKSALDMFRKDPTGQRERKAFEHCVAGCSDRRLTQYLTDGVNCLILERDGPGESKRGIYRLAPEGLRRIGYRS